MIDDSTAFILVKVHVGSIYSVLIVGLLMFGYIRKSNIENAGTVGDFTP